MEYWDIQLKYGMYVQQRIWILHLFIISSHSPENKFAVPIKEFSAIFPLSEIQIIKHMLIKYVLLLRIGSIFSMKFSKLSFLT